MTSFYKKISTGIAVLLVSLSLSGCGTTVKPYATVALAHQIDQNSDWYVRTEREWQCSNPQGEFEVGVEFHPGLSLGYNHQSWVTCGNPLGNNKPELYEDKLILRYKFGGYK